MRPWFVLALAVGACQQSTSLPIEAHCNPLGFDACLPPWPSSAFEVDAATATGRRLAIPAGALPVTVDEVALDPASWNALDGFSPTAPIVVAFPGGISPAALPPADHMGLSLAADSPTVLLDMTTGTRVAHFAELDAAAEGTPDAQALLLRPAARLAAGHRYAVAITSRLTGPEDAELPVPPGFAALRDGRLTDHALLEAMRPRFADVLDALDAAGIAEDDLVVAWDFTVASDAALDAELAGARARAVASFAAAPPRLELGRGRRDDRGVRIATGTLETPRLVREPGGLAVRGRDRVPVTAVIPPCPAPMPIVLYGHELFGDAAEVVERRALAREHCLVLVAAGLRGLTAPDAPRLARALRDLSRAHEVLDRLAQAVIDQVALARALRAIAPRLGGDPERLGYLGVSQGAILGPAIMNHAGLARGVLAAGGANHALVLERSARWRDLVAELRAAYPDPLDATLALHLLAMRLDRFEPVPRPPVLLQAALGDADAPELAAFWQARTLGLPLLAPAPTTPWGLVERAGPLPRSALVLLDGGAPRPPTTNVPAPRRGVHALPARVPAARRQIGRFLATGTIVHTCAGPCTCATGACE